MAKRTGYSHTYHHQANREAERRGEKIKGCLTRGCQGDRNWVGYLPQVRQMYNDTAGPTGFPPYQTVYGRERHNAVLPYEEVKADAAAAWLQKQKDMQR